MLKYFNSCEFFKTYDTWNIWYFRTLKVIFFFIFEKYISGTFGPCKYQKICCSGHNFGWRTIAYLVEIIEDLRFSISLKHGSGRGRHSGWKWSPSWVRVWFLSMPSPGPDFIHGKSGPIFYQQRPVVQTLILSSKSSGSATRFYRYLQMLDLANCCSPVSISWIEAGTVDRKKSPPTRKNLIDCTFDDFFFKYSKVFRTKQLRITLTLQTVIVNSADEKG